LAVCTVYKSGWGDEGYSREELVAEAGSAFLCADLDLYKEPREDAVYIATWLELLKIRSPMLVARDRQIDRSVSPSGVAQRA